MKLQIFLRVACKNLPCAKLLLRAAGTKPATCTIGTLGQKKLCLGIYFHMGN